MARTIPEQDDTPLTRHKERYAQALQAAGKTPTGSPKDEEEAQKILTVKTPLGVPWIEPEDVAPVWSSSPQTVRAWFRARPTMSPEATALTILRENFIAGYGCKPMIRHVAPVLHGCNLAPVLIAAF